uniref:Uncharacterized protein n=1 Tax=Anguilla anguilla TaxID=7936 RepID=A0A0E9WBB8_ANGAN
MSVYQSNHRGSHNCFFMTLMIMMLILVFRSSVGRQILPFLKELWFYLACSSENV